MPRLPHGAALTLSEVRTARAALAARSTDVPLAFAAMQPPDVHDFDFLFADLQNDPANLLPEAPTTRDALVALGRAMQDPGTGADPGDSPIPAAYTYFGQFIDHDTTLETLSAPLPDLLAPGLTPLSLAAIRATILNLRSATLDLDSVYGLPAPRDPANSAKLQVGQVTSLGNQGSSSARPEGKDDDNDLPREPRSSVPSHDRAALIGDPRNDENTIIGQLHTAFLRAHNALVDQGHTFREAQRLLRQHYQHLVIEDFLKRVADPAIVDNIVQNGNQVYHPELEPFFLPLEFSVAAYRFGHTMVRQAYDFNLNFGAASLDLLFTFTALSGQLGFGAGTDTLPENWIIEWDKFVDVGAPFNVARRLDTKLVEPLFHLRALEGTEEAGDGARLAVRNLLRGYLLRLPTGQAVTTALGFTPLSPAEITAAAASPEQVQALTDGGFLDRTPLWYYILVEAAHNGGNQLGPVGSTLVAEVLVGLVRESEDSILRTPGWAPSLPSATPGTFILSDLLTFAGELPGTGPAQPGPGTYVVEPGDSLSSIAANELGDEARWPEIFALNRAEIANPDLIFPGQVLRLPDGPPAQPPLRVYLVQAGDTLRGIAANELGDQARWPEIFALNQDVISDPAVIFIGQFLVLQG